MTNQKGTPTRATSVFVDEIDGDDVRVLLGAQGQTTLLLPRTLLPDGAREGDWVELSVRVVPPPPDDSAARRKRLAADDPGGPIKL